MTPEQLQQRLAMLNEQLARARSAGLPDVAAQLEAEVRELEAEIERSDNNTTPDPGPS